ncbi:hypothetical protein ACQ4PT_020744 [Festuca glaucescens]
MAAGAAANLAGRPGVRVVVIGDPGTGKSSLVVAVTTEQFPENVPKVMPHTRLPADYFPDRVPITIIDTSSRSSPLPPPPSSQDSTHLIAECQAADAVVLTYACDRLSTLERLSTYWLPELRRIQLKAPVIVVGCKLDLRDDQQNSLEQTMAPIMQSFREIETCIECSALRQIQLEIKLRCSTFLNIYGQDLDNDQRYIRTLHPREQKQQKVSRSLGLQNSQVFVTPLLGLGCCRSFRNTADVRLDGVVVGEAEQPARDLLDAGDGRWRSLPRTVGGGARLCSLEAPPPLLLELSRTAGGDVGSPSTEDLAGDGRRGSTPMLPGSPASSAPGAVADGRRVCGLTSGGRGRTAGVRAGGGRGQPAGTELRRGTWTWSREMDLI